MAVRLVNIHFVTLILVFFIKNMIIFNRIDQIKDQLRNKERITCSSPPSPTTAAANLMILHLCTVPRSILHSAVSRVNRSSASSLNNKYYRYWYCKLDTVEHETGINVNSLENKKMKRECRYKMCPNFA